MQEGCICSCRLHFFCHSSKELLRPYLIKSNNFKSLSTVKEGGEREKMCDNGLRSAVADMSAG